MCSLLEKMEEFRLIARIQEDCRFRAKEKQQKAEAKRKDMATQLAKALKDRTAAKDLLLIEHERAKTYPKT